MSKHWGVTVSVGGDPILTIESNCLAGKSDLTAEDEDAIRRAAYHLLAFLGDAVQQSANTKE